MANAADIANLRTDIGVLAAALRDQATKPVEIRKQMDSIRQRLLCR